MLPGTVYGVILNDLAERESLAARFTEPPYRAPPEAPVLCIKPQTCIAASGVRVATRPGKPIVAAATIGLVMGRDATRVTPEQALSCVAGVRLALDLCEEHADYYRPAVAERCRDDFLPLTGLMPLTRPASEIVIETCLDGHAVHRWSLDRLFRPVEQLIASITGFMTLSAGDVLLVGLPGDAPRAACGQVIEVRSDGLPRLVAELVEESQ